MSEENVEIWRTNIESQLAELTAGTSPEATISKMAEIWDPEVELDATEAAVLDLNGVYRGADAVRQFWQEWFSAWETLRFDYELLDAGERVVMLLDMQMRGRSTGIEMPFEVRVGQHVQERVGRPREALHEPRGGPRSRRAVGVNRPA